MVPRPLDKLVAILLNTDEGLSEEQYQGLLDVLDYYSEYLLLGKTQDNIDRADGRVFVPEPKTQTYDIYYRMQCQVKAKSREEAMNKYYNDETTNHEFHEFLSIEEVDD